jgi:hypothetical protein
MIKNYECGDDNHIKKISYFSLKLKDMPCKRPNDGGNRSLPTPMISRMSHAHVPA